METIKTRIFDNHELFNLTIGDNSITARLLGGGAVTETLFFFKKDGADYVFCRAKLPNELTARDLFKFSERQFDNFIESGKVEMF